MIVAGEVPAAKHGDMNMLLSDLRDLITAHIATHGDMPVGSDGSSDYVNLVTGIKMVTTPYAYQGNDVIGNTQPIAMLEIDESSSYTWHGPSPNN